MPSPTQITVAQLSRLIGTPAAPQIIDVRIDEDFNLDPDLIPTAKRYSHTEIERWVSNLDERQVVVYCQKGKKLSQGIVALLHNYGIVAECLQGGHFAWKDAGAMQIPAEKLLQVGVETGSLWVTRHRPKIDRMACPWLIRRFIDPRARFLFVEPAEVEMVAHKFNAIPFDVEGVFWSHRGDHCTFDTMIEEFGLQSEALKRLAVIIRGADTNRHELSAQSAGLLAVSLGLSRMYRNDLDQIEAGMPIYDAFYRWARDAMNESHDWPQPGGGK
jgi:rhodanese-related sulfurtransferase